METRTLLPIIVLDSKGRAYSIRAADIPGGRGDGVPVSSLIDVQAGARVCQAFAAVADTQVLLGGSGGYGFISNVNDMVSRVRAGKVLMTLEEGEVPLTPIMMSATDREIAVLSDSARLLVFPVEEMREMPRGRGVILMGLDEGEALLSVCPVGSKGLVLEGASRGGASATLNLDHALLDKHRLRRARRGSKLETKLKPRSIRPRHA
jgi:topoisomerase-4 subunit A